jgi:hypothetical protein
MLLSNVIGIMKIDEGPCFIVIVSVIVVIVLLYVQCLLFKQKLSST